MRFVISMQQLGNEKTPMYVQDVSYNLSSGNLQKMGFSHGNFKIK